MAIKNYTTEVEVYKSLGEIQGALAGHGARKVMVDYNAAASPPASCLPSKLRPGLVASASLPILTGYGQYLPSRR